MSRLRLKDAKEAGLSNSSAGSRIVWLSICTLASALWAGQLAAQASSDTIRFRGYSVDEGLPQSGVNSIAQDELGYLWLATQDGLTRFDGLSFKTFRHDPSDPRSLPSDQTTAVLADLEGSLWVGSGAGVHRMLPATRNVHLDLSDAPVEEWLTADERLAFEAPPVDPSNAPGFFQPSREMHLDSRGRVWMTSGDISAVWDPGIGQLRRTTSDSAVAPPPPEAVVRALRPRLGRAIFDAWIEDREGVFWLGQVEPWALIRFDPSAGLIDVFRHDPADPESLGDGEIFAIFEDRWGGLWVGTGRGGLNRVLRAGDVFSYLGNAPGLDPLLPSNYVTGISPEPDGGLWVGTDDGLQELLPDGSRGATYGAGASGSGLLAAAYVRAVLSGPSGTVYVGAGDVLHALDRTNRSFRRLNPGEGDLFMTAGLALDASGRVWGAFLRQDGSVVLRAVDDATGEFVESHELLGPGNGTALGTTLVQSIHVSNDGHTWIGTWERGLYRLDARTGEVRHFAHMAGDRSSIPHNTVQVVTEDSGGVIWIGTRGGGLARFNAERDRFTVLGTERGLANNVVYGIVEDADGFLWISSNQGLSRYDPMDGMFSNFDVRDGLQSNEFNRWAFGREADGTLVFGGINGISRFHPASMSPPPPPPLVSLESVSIHNQPIARGRDAAALGRITLAHHQNLLTFEYIGLHSTDADQVRFAYRLEGVEDDWVDAGFRRFVNYANVAPGEYTFRVRAAGGSGAWSDETVALDVSILQPFWRTWWFLSIAAAAAVTVLALGHRYRLAVLLREERIRTSIARDLHDDVSATLSSVAYFAEAVRSDLADRGTPRSERFLDLISRSAGEARDRIGDIIWAISPEAHSWESLLARIRRHASDAFDSHGIAYTIVLPQSVPWKRLSPDRRNHLWLIIKEMVANAVQHARCSHVDITLTAEGKRVRLRFADDGLGFDATVGRTGHGVSNIFERAQELNGTIELTTERGHGTRWDLDFEP